MGVELPVDLSRRRFLLAGNGTSPLPRIAIEAHCLAQSGVYCDSCRDACETGALRFQPRQGAVPQPILNVDLCNQCGECVKLCPRDAIWLRPTAGEVSHG